LVVPIGLVLLVGQVTWLGPYLLRRGAGAPQGLFERLASCGAGAPVVFWAVGVGLAVATVVCLRGPQVRGALVRGGWPAIILGRVMAFLPILATIALLLTSVVAPVSRALSQR